MPVVQSNSVVLNSVVSRFTTPNNCTSATSWNPTEPSRLKAQSGLLNSENQPSSSLRRVLLSLLFALS